MTQESRLVVVIDSKNAERNAKALAEEMSRVTTSGDEVGKQISVTNNIIQNFNTTVNNSNSTINKTTEITRKATQQNQQLSQSFKNTTQEIDKQEKSLNTYNTSIKALAGHVIGLMTVHAAINDMDMYTGLQNRLKLITNSQDELKQAMEDTFRIAQNTRTHWESTIQVYQRFGDNAKTLGIDLNKVAELTETVGKAVAISGASTQAADAALVQFGQALASGVLRGEELNSVMEQTPGLAKAIASGMGITVGELRSVAAQGKITSEELVKALTNAKSEVDELFAKTDVTIQQSGQMLKNEITKFIGETGQASGAASVLANSIQALAQNLNLIADVALLGGVAYLTQAIVTKATAVRDDVVATMASRQASLAKAKAEVAETTATLNAAKAHLANVRATNAETQAKYGATAAALRYSQAQAAVTAATNAQTAAQVRLTTATAAFSRLVKGASGLVGGPIGAITIGVTALSAAYMYFKDRAEQANKKLEEQSKYAGMAAKELKNLNAEQKKTALNELKDKFKDQNAELDRQARLFQSIVGDIVHYNNQMGMGGKVGYDLGEIQKGLNDGTISLNDALKKINKIALITPEQKKQLNDGIDNYEKWHKKVTENAKAQELLGEKVKIAGNAFQNAAIQAKEYAKATNLVDQKTQVLNKKYSEKNLEADFVALNTKKWGSDKDALDKAKMALDFYKDNGIPLTRSLSDKEWPIFEKYVNKQQEVKKLQDDITEAEQKRTEAERKRTKELEKQLELGKMVGAAALGGLRIKSAESIGGGQVRGYTAEFAQLTQDLLGNKLTRFTAFNDRYHKGTKSKHATGNAFDFTVRSAKEAEESIASLNEMAKKYGFTIKTINEYANPSKRATGGHVHVSVLGYNGNVDRIKDAKAEAKINEDSQKLSEQAAAARIQLEREVADKISQIRSKLADKKEEIDKAGYSEGEATKLKAKHQARADNEIAIEQQALKMKLDEYGNFLKSEEDLLKESFARRQFDVEHDLELNKDQRKAAVALLTQQLKQEQALLELAREQRLFQARQAFMSETDLIRERYRLEREEILKNSDIKDDERKQLIRYSEMNEEKELKDRLKESTLEMARIKSEMNGSGQLFEIKQTKASRYQANENWYDSETAVIDHNEVNQLEVLQRQFDAQLLSQQEFEDQKTAIIQAAHEQREAIYKEFKKNEADIDTAAGQAQLDFYIQKAQATVGAFQGMFGAILGEQSAAYKTMFAVNQAFALAEAGRNLWKSASDAYAAESGTVWQKAGAAAKAVIDQGTFIAMIQAATPKGFSDGGYTGHGGKYDEAGIVHKGEVVWSQDDIKRWGGVSVVEAMRKNSPKGYSDGGIVSNFDSRQAVLRESRQHDSIQQSRTLNLIAPKVTIINQTTREVDATTEWDGEELKIKLEEFKKQNEAMVDRKISQSWRDAERQGGALDRIKRSK